MDDHGDGVKVRTRLELEPNVSVMKCARNKTTRSWCALSVDVLVSVLDATQAVKCGVASSSPSSLASVSLSFRSTCTILLFHIVVLILLVVILYQFIQVFTRSHFSHMFSLYSHGILGVVFTQHGSMRVILESSLEVKRNTDSGGIILRKIFEWS